MFLLGHLHLFPLYPVMLSSPNVLSTLKLIIIRTYWIPGSLHGIETLAIFLSPTGGVFFFIFHIQGQ